MRTEILLAGTGGRGVILAGAVMAKGAVLSGKNASYGAIYGAEVRGGLTAAEVVISDQAIDFPFIERPHLSFAFDQKSYDKYISEHEPSRLLLLDGDFVSLRKEHKVRVLRVPFTHMASENIGNPVVANMVALGFIAGLVGLFGPPHAARALAEDVSPRFLDMDEGAFKLGYEKAKEYGRHWEFGDT